MTDITAFVFFAVMFGLGTCTGYFHGLGRPDKFLPPVGAIIRIYAHADDGSFLCEYLGKTKCFKWIVCLEPGLYKVELRKEFPQGNTRWPNPSRKNLVRVEG